MREGPATVNEIEIPGQPPAYYTAAMQGVLLVLEMVRRGEQPTPAMQAAAPDLMVAVQDLRDAFGRIAVEAAPSARH